MVAKNFKKFLRFRRNDGRRQQNASNEEKLCYKCHKPGHMKMDCPIYKKEKKERRDVWERVKRRQLSNKENKEKERAMNAEHTPIWSDFDSILPEAITIVSTLRGFGSEEQMQRINGEANVVTVNAAKEYGKISFAMLFTMKQKKSLELFYANTHLTVRY
ncbi:hypothetical protein RJ639_020436 [Escallonia herrerae]|uniref:CCHC-type domain-containing protein n=1 Tax=Escallonia herrerae TaxID=1293975 RepID=A0AA88V4U5_9ASTE|nr:hypothetical protein RJ639_020436 [Escallonia herrerae]